MPISEKKSRFEDWECRWFDNLVVVFCNNAENQKRGFFDFIDFFAFFFEMGVELVAGSENEFTFFTRFCEGSNSEVHKLDSSYILER